ncbi:sugar phosphate isomerase/epimerase family protein [Nitratireductor alexandrii]|uniref:sugar phosphate isomerase/epimerase family protein n=1 Tax=Nitratireductor alexandrii TaxID=2448161 RepID=UPI000FDC1FEA|nr:sugar phosphate isomerase/epimerase family protein [Nitratireductor alexandrii]
MKFGIHAGLWMRSWSDDLAPILRTAADIGFDGVELSLLGIGLDRAADLRRQAQALGLELTCSTGLAADADPTSDDPAMRARAEAVLAEAIATTQALGARSLAGVVAAPWGVFEPARKADRAARAAETLGRLDGRLRDGGVRLGIEAINRFETDLTNTAAEAVAIAEATGSAQIGVLLDTFHMNVEEKDPPAAIATAGERLYHFHVSDNDRGVPGSGRYDFAASAAALRAIGYDGWVTAEMFVVPGHSTSADLNIWRAIEADPTEAARAALSFMKRVFA